MPSLQLICLDADDTLWHNMRHFEATEAALADLLAPFAEHRVARATLAEVETRNLALYGYGAKSFTLSMIETALELCGDALTAAELRAILEAGRALLAHPVELFDGIAETIEALATSRRWCSSPRAICSTRKASSPPLGWARISPASRS